MCHSRHHHRRPVERSSAERRDPGLRASDPGLRASDDERESIVNELREHGAAGRLEVEELEQRVAAAYTARTHGELGALLGDLPRAAPARRPSPAPQRHLHGHGDGHGWGGFVGVNALLVAIWAVSGAGYFWPAWVMVWWAFALLLKSGPGLLRLR